jgi:hypothetical protein
VASRRGSLDARLRPVLLAVLTALSTLLLPAAVATATGPPAGATRDGAIHPVVVTEPIAAGQHWVRDLSQSQAVSGHKVLRPTAVGRGPLTASIPVVGERPTDAEPHLAIPRAHSCPVYIYDGAGALELPGRKRTSARHRFSRSLAERRAALPPDLSVVAA